jgi:hypothetical protein
VAGAVDLERFRMMPSSLRSPSSRRSSNAATLRRRRCKARRYPSRRLRMVAKERPAWAPSRVSISKRCRSSWMGHLIRDRGNRAWPASSAHGISLQAYSAVAGQPCCSLGGETRPRPTSSLAGWTRQPPSDATVCERIQIERPQPLVCQSRKSERPSVLLCERPRCDLVVFCDRSPIVT